MSVHVISWVMDHSDARGSERLVLIALADRAEKDGTNAWPSVASIAHDTRLSERTVQYALRGLERSGAIRRNTERHRTANQRHGTYIYDVIMEGAESAPFDPQRVQDAPPKGANHDAQRVHSAAPEPSLEPSVVQPSFEVHNGAALEPATSKGVASPVNADLPANRPAKVGGKKVTDGEYEFATFVLMTFNQRAETRYSAKPYIEMIIRRMREHPEMTGEHHAILINKTLANPWWDGPPSPNVIYGNAGIFEKSVHAAVMPSTKGPLTREEIRSLGSRR